MTTTLSGSPTTTRPGRALLGLLLGLTLVQAEPSRGAEPLDADTWRAQNDAAVAEFRAAHRAHSPTASREGLERALALLDDLLATEPPDDASERRARCDRVVIMAALGRGVEALAAVAALEAEGEQLPAYVLSSAGDAASSLGDPAGALRRYEEALALDPDAEAAHAGRIFALADLDRLDVAAEILEDRLARTQDEGLRIRDRLRLALVQAWSGRLDWALQETEALLDASPTDVELLVQRGGLLLQADRPEAALAVYDAALELEPGSRRAAVGRAQALARAARWPEADTAFGALAAEDPTWLPLARALAEAGADRAAQISWDARRAEGPDRELAGREIRWEARVTSARTGGGWRAFAGRRAASAERDGRTLDDRRWFAGVSLQRGSWRLRLEADRADDRFAEDDLVDADGLSVEATWRASDAWTVSAGWADDAFDLPLRAREQGIVGDLASAAVRWQPRAQHGLRLSTSVVDFTDGNRSRTLGLSSTSRWPVARRLGLLLEPGVYTSRQSRQDVPYFSPRRDLSFELGGALEQRLWSAPGRRLRHALDVGVGQYRQDGFDAEATGRLGYRVEWDFGPSSRVYLRAGRARHVYDGAVEYQNRVELGGWWALGRSER